MKRVYQFRFIMQTITVYLFFSLIFVSSLFAQGKLTGRVVDASTGEALPSVNVVITHQVVGDGREVPLSRAMGASTDLEGYYFILNVPPGVYNLKATSVGYNPTTQRQVKVDNDRTITVNFNLSSTELQVQQVVVTAEREIIKKDVAATQEVITTARIEQMPVLRMDEFAGKLKGVELISGEQGNGLSVRGGSIRETDIRLDGISLQDPRTDNAYLGFNSTSIQEVQVLTGGFEAKYGGIRSGLMNVVTKEGQRERFTASFNVNYTPNGQKRFFGTDPWSNDSWIYRVYAGEYAWRGVPQNDPTIPSEFSSFKGWADRSTLSKIPLDSVQKRDLWLAQHPQYKYADKPDYYVEGTITGPILGSSIPVWGEFASRSTFLLGFKYEDSQLAFPVGPRNNYVDWNTQLKITSQLPNNMKLSVNGMYAKTKSVSGGSVTNYGGSLQDQASSFSFLNSTETSVAAQARMINGNNLFEVFNRSRRQYYDQRYIVGGAKLTHSYSDKAFYTVDFQMGFTDQDLQPFAYPVVNGQDSLNNMVSFYSTRAKRNYYFFIPTMGSPNASTNQGNDALDQFRMFGGPQRVDSSYSYMYQLKTDYTAQLGRHNQFEAGISGKLQDLFVYTGTWYQSQVAFTPDTWQYYKATPLEIGAYVQDKLEFEGMVLNLGLRLDYFDPMKKGFTAGFPTDMDYTDFYNLVYASLPGANQSYERWVEFRKLLENPTGWPQGENQTQTYLSPRLGVSFPITESSKMYFNYGHFYQRAPVSFLYNTLIYPSAVTVPTPGLRMGRTVQYEFGYEQMFFNDFVFNVTAYYKDVSNEPLARTYENWYEDNVVTQYESDRYSDTRGLELRIERPFGRFVSFNAMYDYMLQSYGQSGLAKVYENRIKAREGETRTAWINNTQARPRANISLNIHTPTDFGPTTFGTNLLGGIYTNFFFEWRDGGKLLLNSQETEVRLQQWVDIVNYWNIDFKGSKSFNTPYGNFEINVTIENLTNNKWLNTGNMTSPQYENYKNSLKTPDKGGNDKWGEYKKDYIDIGWWTAPLFLNPRRIIVGMRLNL